MAYTGDIVAKLVLQTSQWINPLAGVRNSTKASTAGIAKDVVDLQAKIRAAGDAVIKGEVTHRGRLIGLLKEEHAEREKSLAAARVIATQRFKITTDQTEKLRIVRNEIENVTLEYERQGRLGGERLTQLVALEHKLAEAARQRAAMMERARLAAGIGQVPDFARRGGVAAGGRLSGAAGAANFTGLAYGLSDAATAYQFGGTRAALLAASNNLPMIGESVGQAASRFAKLGGIAGRTAGIVGRFAGPAGLFASVAVPLTTALIPALGKGSDSLDKIAESAKRVQDALAFADQLSAKRREMSDLREAIPGGTGDVKAEILAQRREIEKLTEAYRNAQAEAAGLAAAQRYAATQDTYANRLFNKLPFGGLDTPNLAGQTAEIDKALRERMTALDAARERMRNLDRLQAERTAQDQAAATARWDASGAKFREGYIPFERRQAFERRQEARAEAERSRKIDEEAMQRSLRSGVIAANIQRDQRERSVALGGDLLRQIDPKRFEMLEIERERRERVAELDQIMPRRFVQWRGVDREVRNPQREAMLAAIDQAAEVRRRGDGRKGGPDTAVNSVLHADSVEGVSAIVRATQGGVGGRNEIVASIGKLSDRLAVLLGKIERHTADTERRARRAPVVTVGRER